MSHNCFQHSQGQGTLNMPLLKCHLFPEPLAGKICLVMETLLGEMNNE
jgi:hypothetical protein